MQIGKLNKIVRESKILFLLIRKCSIVKISEIGDKIIKVSGNNSEKLLNLPLYNIWFMSFAKK